MVLTIVTTRHDVDARGVEIFDRAQLHVEQVADLAVRIGLFADAVELQVRDAQPASLASRAKSGSWAKRMPLVAACTLK